MVTSIVSITGKAKFDSVNILESTISIRFVILIPVLIGIFVIIFLIVLFYHIKLKHMVKARYSLRKSITTDMTEMNELDR